MEYGYSVLARYDVGALDAAIRGDATFAALGFQGVSVDADAEDLHGRLRVVFAESLPEAAEGILRGLVVRFGSSAAIYQQRCVVCDREFTRASIGRPIYCPQCQTPFSCDCPHGQYVWSDPGKQLRRWAEVAVFVPFDVVLAEVPHGGVVLSGIEMENVSPPVLLEVLAGGFWAAFQVGIVNALWENTSLRFDWRVQP
jgi:hypothetical protein